MANNSENDIKLVSYKKVAKKKALDCYYANREVIMEKNRNRYRALSPKEKKKRYEPNRQWYNRQSAEKKAEIKEKRREYCKNRYNKLMVEIK